jgi:hypothetical protein
MTPEIAEHIAKELGCRSYPASLRPAYYQDHLLLGGILSHRAPLIKGAILAWGEDPPPLSVLLSVAGDHDAPRTDGSGKLFRRNWGKAYTFCADRKPQLPAYEFITYSTEDAFVLSKFDEDACKVSELRRVITCLSRAIFEAQNGLVCELSPEEGHRDNAKLLAEGLFLALLPEATRQHLLKRFHDVPTFRGWTAPEWNNSWFDDLVQCCLAGGKAAGVHYPGVPDSLELPAYAL